MYWLYRILQVRLIYFYHFQDKYELLTWIYYTEGFAFVVEDITFENWDQKIKDIKEYHIDTFVIGDDWKGKFDYLKDEGVEVIYLPRTPEISTTQIKEDLHHTEEK